MINFFLFVSRLCGDALMIKAMFEMCIHPRSGDGVFGLVEVRLVTE